MVRSRYISKCVTPDCRSRSRVWQAVGDEQETRIRVADSQSTPARNCISFDLQSSAVIHRCSITCALI